MQTRHAEGMVTETSDKPRQGTRSNAPGRINASRGRGERRPAGERRRTTGGAAAERSASDRRAEILRLAAGLFAERGFKATTVRDIAEAAGVLSGSLYHHFNSKESIIEELLREYVDELLSDYRRIIAEDGSPREVLSRLANSVFASFAEHRAAIMVWQNERQTIHRPGFAYLAQAQAEVERLWTGVIRQGIEAGEFREDLDPRLAYRFIRDSAWMAVHWYSPDGPLTSQQVAAHYLAIMLDGIDSRRRCRRA
jgi:TetR/AcrR family transcriptional regulator, cholesterol catabolism regulator